MGRREISQSRHDATQQLSAGPQNRWWRSSYLEQDPASQEYIHRGSWQVAEWTSCVLRITVPGTCRRCSSDRLCRSPAATSGSTVSSNVTGPGTYSQPHRSLLDNSSNQFINGALTDYHFDIQNPDSTTNTLPNSYSAEKSRTQKLETQCRYAAEKHDVLLREVNAMEVKLNINGRWTITSPEYISTSVPSIDYSVLLSSDCLNYIGLTCLA